MKIPLRRSERVALGSLCGPGVQPPDQGAAGSIHVDSVKVIGTKFPVVFLTFQHVISNDQERVSYRHDRAFGPPSRSDAPIQRREVVILGHRDRPGRLRQTSAERNIALAHLAAQSLPGALKITGTQTS